MSLFPRYSWRFQLYDSGRNEAAFRQYAKDFSCIFIDRTVYGVEGYFGREGAVVWVVDTGKAGNTTASGLCIHSLCVAGLTDIERRVDKNLNEPFGTNDLPDLVSDRAIGTHGSTDGNPAMPDDLGGDVPYSQDIDIPVFLRKSEALRKIRTHDVAVEQRDASAELVELDGQQLGGR